MEDEIYGRQKLLEGLKIPKTITVVGCGGTGFWIGLFGAMSGVDNVILIDYDKIEKSNLNRLLVRVNEINYYKVDILRARIRDYRPMCRVETHSCKLQSPRDCIILRGTVFCCTDELKSQQLTHSYCENNGLPYQRCGYDGDGLNVSRSFPMSFDDNVMPGYRVDPSWIVPAANAATAALYSQFKSEITLTESMSTLHCADSTIIPEELRLRLIKEGENNVKQVEKEKMV